MNWVFRPDYVAKINVLDPRVRPQFEEFLHALDRKGMRYALGDTRRDEAREWELWKIGRRPPEEGDAGNPHLWVVMNPGLIVTRVPPGSGKGPHFFGLAGDVYPVDEHGALMQTHDLHWIDTITQMWTLAETCGLDALGHKQEDRPGDEYWSGDPCHFQAHGWRSMIPSAVSKEV